MPLCGAADGARSVLDLSIGYSCSFPVEVLLPLWLRFQEGSDYGCQLFTVVRHTLPYILLAYVQRTLVFRSRHQRRRSLLPMSRIKTNRFVPNLFAFSLIRRFAGGSETSTVLVEGTPRLRRFASSQSRCI